MTTTGDDDEIEENVDVPNAMVGLIIGRGGENIRDLQLRSGAHIQIERDSEAEPGSRTRRIMLKGEVDRVAKAKALIDGMIAEREQELGGRGGGRRTAPGATSLQVPIPNDKVGLIIGRGGMTIKGIQERTGANIQIPPEPDANDPTVRTIEISGEKEQAENAQNEVYSLLAQGPPGGGGGGGGGGGMGGGMPQGGGNMVYMQVANDKVSNTRRECPGSFRDVFEGWIGHRPRRCHHQGDPEQDWCTHPDPPAARPRVQPAN
jgi:far upstream element-binding protein